MTLTQATWNCAKIMLSLTQPFQVMFKTNLPRNTHFFCNQQAIKIMKRDGLSSESLLLKTYIEALNQGSSWSDRGFKNISHYYNHLQDAGLWHGPAAPTECQNYFRHALKYWHRGQKEKSFFYLGAASHILQDLCVPHHAGCVVLSGHKYFEDWARLHYEEFALPYSGIYNLADSASDWVKENSVVASDYLPILIKEQPTSIMEKVVGIMLQRAQRTTSGFFYFFIQSTQKKTTPSGELPWGLSCLNFDKT